MRHSSSHPQIVRRDAQPAVIVFDEGVEAGGGPEILHGGFLKNITVFPNHSAPPNPITGAAAVVGDGNDADGIALQAINQ